MTAVIPAESGPLYAGHMMIHHTLPRTIGQIVADDYRAAAVLDRYGLDFCFGGKRTLDEACRERGIEPSRVEADLESLGVAAADERVWYSDWAPDALIDYIVSRHHAYVRGALPVILAHTTKIATVHGERRPELVHVAQRFAELSRELSLHMAKEEEILFPYVKSLVDAERRAEPIAPSPFGTVHNPVRMMEHDHERAGQHLQLIRQLTNGYELPDVVCTTYRVTFEELQEFERDLHQHVHLENNVLFPAAVRLEEELRARS